MRLVVLGSFSTLREQLADSRPRALQLLNDPNTTNLIRLPARHAQ